MSIGSNCSHLRESSGASFNKSPSSRVNHTEGSFSFGGGNNHRGLSSRHKLIKKEGSLRSEMHS